MQGFDVAEVKEDHLTLTTSDPIPSYKVGSWEPSLPTWADNPPTNLPLQLTLEPGSGIGKIKKITVAKFNPPFH